MSGVQTGSRLERLLALEAQVKHEIDAERRRIAQGIRIPPRTSSGGRAYLTAAHDKTYGELGVSTRQIKEWAIRVGLLERARRGRAPKHIVDAYREAHP